MQVPRSTQIHRKQFDAEPLADNFFDPLESTSTEIFSISNQGTFGKTESIPTNRYLWIES